MGVDIRVCAHPSRAGFVTDLLNDLRLPDSAVTWDPDPDGPPAMWPVWRETWMHPTDATHRLVLQDDAVPCRDLRLAANRLARLYPERVMTLYTVRAAHEERAQRTGKSVLKLGAWRNGVAILMPVWIARLYVRWTEETVGVVGGPLEHDHIVPVGKQAMLHDDVPLEAFLKYQEQPMWGVYPSLVQHGLPSASLLGHSRAGRQSPYFIGEDVSAMSVDWTLTE